MERVEEEQEEGEQEGEGETDMPASDYTRPASGHVFKFNGVKITVTPDSLPPDKYPYAQNVRGYKQDSVVVRPAVTQQYAPPAGGGPVLALEPTLQIRKAAGTVYNGNTSLDTGYDSVFGCSLIPFRPNQSPQAWEYVFDRVKSTKILLSPLGNVVDKVGIAEPQSPCDAAAFQNSLAWTGPHPSYVQGGTAGVPSGAGNRSSETVLGVFPDGITAGGLSSLLTTIQVSGNVAYSRDQLIIIDGGVTKILDVFPGTPLGSPFGLTGIFYYAGITGRAVVVPNNIGSGPGQGTSIYDTNLTATIRRGALVEFSGGVPEICRIIGVSTGPDGSIAFEVVTTSPHTAAETINFVPGIQVPGFGNAAIGQTILINDVTFAMTTGFGWQSTTLSLSYFVNALQSFQPSDLLHMSIKFDNLANFIEGKLLIDVGNGDFISNVYVWSFRVNDIQQGLPDFTGGTGGYGVTQLGIAQLVIQRQLIDEQTASEHNNQGKTASSLQVTPGNGQWSELSIPINELTRIGSDDTKTLQNMTGMRLLINASGALNVTFVTPDVFGGFQPDTTATGIPYLYRIRPRSSVTGAKGNPSPEMRYGVTSRRMSNFVVLPLTAYDPQFDMWDVFRMGGSIDQYVFVGTVPVGTSGFTDNYSDAAISQNQVLEEDNYEPFPSVLPQVETTVSSGGATVTGHTIISPLPGLSPASALALLPGNILQVNQQEYVLWARPVAAGGTLGNPLYLLQLTQNAGVLTNASLKITEPLIANQLLNTVWGPDVNGVMFAVNDLNRPGFIYTTKPNNPDASSDNAVELSSPTEPLIGGCLADGTSIAFSTKRAWRGYPQQAPDGSLAYNWIEIPVGEGAVSNFGIASDGQDIYYIARDGIRKVGEQFPVTDDDLFSIFPHEGLFPANYTYAGQTVYAPDYIYKDSFRLAIVNKFLFFDYRDSGNVPRTLVLDVRTGAWVPDVYPVGFTVHAGTVGDIETNALSLIQQLWAGAVDGSAYTELPTSSLVPGAGESIPAIVITKEDNSGDLRAGKWYGDADLNCLSPSPATGIEVTPVVLGVPVAGVAPTFVPAAQSARASYNISLAGGQLLVSLGLILMWTDQGTVTRLYSWQPSYIPKPETIFTRFTDWDDSGMRENKFYQGFILEADTGGVVKQFFVRDADTGLVRGTFNFNHNGQIEKAYVFTAPFLAHSVRLEPAVLNASVGARIYSVKWVFEKTPEAVTQWTTQATSHGLEGYQHVRELMLTYQSTTPLTLVVTVDGNPGFLITFPSTAGLYRKIPMAFPPNKGFVYQYSLSAAAPFQVWANDIEMEVKPWGSRGDYQRVKLLGSEMGPHATI